ncbi:17613_t:CDS:10, partial [Acaulospora colombiana]
EKATADEEKIWAKIEREQNGWTKQVFKLPPEDRPESIIKPFNLSPSLLSGFRYRMQDAYRSVTGKAVKEARIKELKNEVLNSGKLKAHFEDHPMDLEYLRHDKPLHPTRVQTHMKYVPSYLLPKNMTSAVKVDSSTGEQTGQFDGAIATGVIAWPAQRKRKRARESTHECSACIKHSISSVNPPDSILTSPTATMYEDDLSDLLPQRRTALPSFNDDVDDPFKNPFNDGSDPWAAQPTAGGFGDWNTNAFADEPSHNISSLPQDPVPISPDSPTASRRDDPIAQKEDVSSPSHHDERPPTIYAETPVVENVVSATPSTAVVDPLDAALSNVEEPPEHIPVFKRKLPLVINDQTTTTPEPSAASDAKTEKKGQDPETEAPEANEDANKVATTPLATPTQVTEERPSDSAEPEGVPVLSQPTLEIPSSTPDTSFSNDNQVTPPHSLTRVQSTSDIESKSSLDKVAISPLERTPAMLPNPLDKTYTAPPPLSLGSEMGAGGWGDGWNPAPSNGNFYAVSNTSAQPALEQSPTHGEEAAKEREEEDPEDNIPLAHSLPKAPIPMYTITVGDPQKVGDPISAHIIYTVHTKTTNSNYKKSQFSVLRRYSDFVWLFETLCNNNPGVIVPPIPEKNSFGRFQEEFVAARRLALNKCIQKMANHPGLCNDKDLQLFLESDNFSLDVGISVTISVFCHLNGLVSQIKHRRAEENTGLLSMFSSTITGTKFYETDEWFETKKAYLDGLENQLKGLVRSMEAVAKQRAESSQALSELAETLEAVSTADISKQLSNAFSHLATVQRKAKELQDEQAQQDVITFAGTVEEYGRMIGSVRLAFGSRVKCFNQWQNAENELRRVKTNYDRAKKQSKTPERLHYFMQEVADAERKVIHTKSEFERVTKLLKIELHRFDMERVEDFKRSLEAFLDGMIRRQKELINSWGEYQSTLLQKSETNPESNGPEGDEEPTAVEFSRSDHSHFSSLYQSTTQRSPVFFNMSWVSILASVGMAVGPPLVYADQSEWHLPLYQTTPYGFSRQSTPKSERLTNPAFIGYSIIKKKDATGFSRDVTAILLIANITRCMFWIGKRFEFGPYPPLSKLVDNVLKSCHQHCSFRVSS